MRKHRDLSLLSSVWIHEEKLLRTHTIVQVLDPKNWPQIYRNRLSFLNQDSGSNNGFRLIPC
uniref:Uncharacterized protein n=1 Tax=Tetranychus urticae TaxID=32264 RepID=T1K6Z7_TETUR